MLSIHNATSKSYTPTDIGLGIIKLRVTVCVPETNDTDLSLVGSLTFQAEVPVNVNDAPNNTVMLPVELIVYVNVTVEPGLVVIGDTAILVIEAVAGGVIVKN